MFLVQKYTEYKAAAAEQHRKKVTEKELSHLNHKIDKLLQKLEEHGVEEAQNQDEECVICVSAKATIRTMPCSHCCLCQQCIVKTIKMTISKRLPLTCVLCRAKILSLKQSSSRVETGLPQSASLYSVSSNASNSSGVSRSSSSSANSAKTDPTPSTRKAQIPKSNVRSASPSPVKACKRRNNCPSKGKAKLSQDFQREFRMGIRTVNNTPPTSKSGVISRIRCCRQLVSEAEVWKKGALSTPTSAQGRRG